MQHLHTQYKSTATTLLDFKIFPACLSVRYLHFGSVVPVDVCYFGEFDIGLVYS
jgi:hypothetical protein